MVGVFPKGKNCEGCGDCKKLKDKTDQKWSVFVFHKPIVGFLDRMNAIPMSSSLEQSVLKTLAWFSVSNRSVTGFEIWKWLLEPDRTYSIADVYFALSSSEWLRNRMNVTRGFYCLRSPLLTKEGTGEVRTEVYDPSPTSVSLQWIFRRQDHYIDAIRKFHKLRRAAYFFELFESVRTVAAVNSIAWWNTDATSDIDLFIVVKPNSIWSSRFWIVAPFILFGIRPHVQETIDPFCFSFCVTTNNLSMDHLRLKEGDHYFAFWAKSIVPIFDRDKNLEQLDQENPWASTMLPNASTRRVHSRHRPHRVFPIMRHTGLFESVYKSIQQKRFPSSISSIANKDSRVVITDDMLKFHDNDRRAEFEERYKQIVDKSVSR